MAEEPTADHTASRQPTSARRTYIVIAAVAVGFAVIMLVREPIQARYFAWQLTREGQHDEGQRHYFFRLACLKDAALPAIRGMLVDDKPEHRQFGARLLSYVSPNAARPFLIETLNDTDADVRRTAAMSLALDDDPSVADAFCEMIRSDNADAAALAAGMLGRMGGNAAVDALLDVLASDPSVMVKAEAIDGLGQIREERAVPLVTAALTDDRSLPHPTEWDRLASEALEAVRPRLADEIPASQPVERLLDTPSTVSEVAARALRRLNGETKATSQTGGPRP